MSYEEPLPASFWVFVWFCLVFGWSGIFFLARVIYFVWPAIAVIVGGWLVWQFCGWVREEIDFRLHPSVYHYRKPYEKGDPWP